MCSVTRQEIVRNEYTRESFGVAGIVEKIRKDRLKWFGHMLREELKGEIKLERNLARGGLKKNWTKVIKKKI